MTLNDQYVSLLDKWKDYKAQMHSFTDKELVILARKGNTQAVTELAFRADRKTMTALSKKMDELRNEFYS